jgi:predicted SprT family Zn-dependent metalloprotease
LIDGTHKEPALATTTTWIDSETRKILKAKIVLKNQWANVERILEHELGHAFGWKDYNRTGHLMNHNWSLSGLDTADLEKIE